MLFYCYLYLPNLLISFLDLDQFFYTYYNVLTVYLVYFCTTETAQEGCYVTGDYFHINRIPLPQHTGFPSYNYIITRVSFIQLYHHQSFLHTTISSLGFPSHNYHHQGFLHTTIITRVSFIQLYHHQAFLHATIS